MRPTDRNTLAGMVSVVLAAFTLTPLTVDRSYLVLSVLLIALAGAATVGLRRAGLSSPVVLATQLALVAGFSVLDSLTMTGVGEPVGQH
ncbi:MAG: Transglutaminase-like superfamily protein, partial [Friedmanniella sp.]|nr:Transglutaminase-like superfamily protein [Friedmanniella sp.]